MKKTAIQIMLLVGIIGSVVILTGCASDFGKACTRFVTP